MPYKDPAVRKEKNAQYSRDYYTKNRTKILARVKRSKRDIKDKFAAYKTTLSCTKCGQNHPATLDFHHVEYHPNNKKVFKLVSDGHWWKRIEEELAKCIVLCANCHRIHHHEEREKIKQKNTCKAEKK